MASTYLTKTFGSAGNRKTWTWSAWIKKSALGSSVNYLFSAGTDGVGADRRYGFYLYNDLLYQDRYGGSNNATPLLRDASAWYHIVIAMDTTQATASNRTKVYINNTLYNLTTLFNQNEDTPVNSTLIHAVGVGTDNLTANHFDGSMSHVHFIDGTAYDADTFGETDATTGIWKPKIAPSVTYGTNGFFLKFENSGAFGTDSSGNTNNFTVNGTMTQLIDTPSNVFSVLNYLKFTNTSLSNGNTTFTANGASWTSKNSTLGMSSGKWYAEFKMTSASVDYSGIGIASDLTPEGNFVGSDATRSPAIAYNTDGKKHVNGTSTVGYFSTLATNDIVGVALDIDGGTVQFYKNGSVSGSPINLSDAFTSSDYPLFFVCCNIFSTSTQANFGNGYFGTTAVASAQNPDDGIGIFEYDVPAGYYALCTKSINAQEYD